MNENYTAAEYKDMLELKCKQYYELEKKLATAECRIGELNVLLNEARQERDDAVSRAEERERACQRMQGQVDAFEYCIRYYMAGDGR